MSRQLTKQEAHHQQLAQQQEQQQYARDVETHEHKASANASQLIKTCHQAGLNLNLFGALSGALSSKSKKTTHKNADGSEVSVEDRHDQAMANGYAQGQAQAYAQGNAEQMSRAQKGTEIGQAQGQKRVAAKEKMEMEMDGIGVVFFRI
ncbi:hypothetical protein B0J11DRAFT_68878 [Dendryphion nanum]|uniref:Uncharacterized protein n=1 Tax=Dendryphion nanum TaxID=256645 RepID=A0A9P9DIF4_9PLEO|nr:hypothetical protein B0J11DRAFT_68878 [Dendryphion nanum]